VLIGPASFAILGQLQNFLMLLQNATSGLLINGVTKLTAQAEGDQERQRRIWSTAGAAIVFLTLLTAAAVILAREWIAKSLLGDAIYATPLVLAAITLTAFGMTFLIATIFAGKSDVRPFAIINSAIALINLAVVSAGAYWGHIEGALMASAVSQSLALIVGIILMHNRGWYGFRLARPVFDPAIGRSLAKYSMMAIVAAAAFAGGQLIVRSQIISEFGLVTAGIYEALWRLSMINQLIFSSTILVYALPRMTQLAGKREFRGFYIKALLAAASLAVIIFAIEYLLRAPMFRLLFSREFEGAAQYFGYQAVGDVARVATFIARAPFHRARDYPLRRLRAGMRLLCARLCERRAGARLYGLLLRIGIYRGCNDDVRGQ